MRAPAYSNMSLAAAALVACGSGGIDISSLLGTWDYDLRAGLGSCEGLRVEVSEAQVRTFIGPNRLLACHSINSITNEQDAFVFSLTALTQDGQPDCSAVKEQGAALPTTLIRLRRIGPNLEVRSIEDTETQDALLTRQPTVCTVGSQTSALGNVAAA